MDTVRLHWKNYENQMNKNLFWLALFAAAFTGCKTPAPKPPAVATLPGYKDTPMLPGGKWHVHDPDRPQPVVVTPGTFSTQKEAGIPPSDAIVLFNGWDLSAWRDDKGNPPVWEV